MQVLGARGLKFATIGSPVYFRERDSGFACRYHLIGINGHTDGVGRELRGGAHPLAGFLPVAKIVGLQFHAVTIGVFIVE